VAVGKLTLHRFNGEEIFAISTARALVVPEADQVAIILEIETEEVPLKTLEDTKELLAQPNADLKITLPKAQLSPLVGRKFLVPNSWDEGAGDYVSRFYYCEHEDLNENEIEFGEFKAGSIHVRWTGTTVDVNYYDGSKPPTRVVIDAWFTIRH